MEHSIFSFKSCVPAWQSHFNLFVDSLWGLTSEWFATREWSCDTMGFVCAWTCSFSMNHNRLVSRNQCAAVVKGKRLSLKRYFRNSFIILAVCSTCSILPLVGFGHVQKSPTGLFCAPFFIANGSSLDYSFLIFTLLALCYTTLDAIFRYFHIYAHTALNAATVRNMSPDALRFQRNLTRQLITVGAVFMAHMIVIMSAFGAVIYTSAVHHKHMPVALNVASGIVLTSTAVTSPLVRVISKFICHPRGPRLTRVHVRSHPTSRMLT